MFRKFLHKIKKLLRPIYYSSMAYRVFNLIERMTGYKIERHRIYNEIGYYPDLKNPKTFNEKVLWKKIYDRNPLLPVITDKYRVKDYLKDILGENEAHKIMAPLYYMTEDPKTIPFDELPEEYVIKPNHSSGKIILAENVEGKKRYRIVQSHNIYVLNENTQARREVIKVCKEWLSMTHGFDKHEWAYRDIKRKILIEKLLRDSSGKTPVNYNFSVFHGKCHFISVFHGRFGDPNIARYTRDWEYLNVKGKRKQAAYEKKPENLSYMIELAERLGKSFDFIRVDLYLVDNHVYFSELTNYPMSGRVHFNPISFDFEMGSKWALVPEYWKQAIF